MNILQLIDGSSAVSDETFNNLIKFILRALLVRLELKENGTNRVALLQYSNKSIIEKNLTDSRYELSTAINSKYNKLHCDMMTLY